MCVVVAHEHGVVVGTATLLYASIGVYLSILATVIETFFPSENSEPVAFKLPVSRRTYQNALNNTSTPLPRNLSPASSARTLKSALDSSKTTKAPSSAETLRPSHDDEDRIPLAKAFASTESAEITIRSNPSTPEPSTPVADPDRHDLTSVSSANHHRHHFRLSKLKWIRGEKSDHHLDRRLSCPPALVSVDGSSTPSLPSPTSTEPPSSTEKCRRRKSVLHDLALVRRPSCPVLHASERKLPQTPLRTHPYEAPYFFPTPGSAAARDYVPARRSPGRSQTLPPSERKSPMTSPSRAS